MTEISGKKIDLSEVKYCTCCGLPKEKKRVGRPKKIISDDVLNTVEKNPIGRPKKFISVKERENHRKEYQKKYHEKRQLEYKNYKDGIYNEEKKTYDLSSLNL